MPRKARQKSITDIYHVMVRGLNKLAIFYQLRERTRIVNLIRENLQKYDIGIYAYCIMPNHFHLLIKADVKILASFMAKILAAYAHYYNYKHDRIGYVFQDRFKSQCIEDISYFWNCLRYIHMNPLKEQNSAALLEYRHCSLKEFYFNRRDIISKEALELKNGRFKSEQEFLEFHKKRGRFIFADTFEDCQQNNLRIAKEVLVEMQYKKELSAEEILDYIQTRRMFENYLVEILNTSRRKVQDIIKLIRKDSVGTE